jgi:chloramphenicol O-acetyltransferase type A
VNNNRNFRFSFDNNGRLGYWDELVAQYPLFHDDDQTFSYIYTAYSEEFPLFYQHCVTDMAAYQGLKGMETRKPPANSFSVSCIPWVSFTGFNLNIMTDGRYLSPIITWGKYSDQAGKLQLPLAVQIHHAVADGYHTSQFINDVQHLATTHKDWLRI